MWLPGFPSLKATEHVADFRDVPGVGPLILTIQGNRLALYHGHDGMVIRSWTFSASGPIVVSNLLDPREAGAVVRITSGTSLIEPEKLEGTNLDELLGPAPHSPGASARSMVGGVIAGADLVLVRTVRVGSSMTTTLLHRLRGESIEDSRIPSHNGWQWDCPSIVGVTGDCRQMLLSNGSVRRLDTEEEVGRVPVMPGKPIYLSPSGLVVGVDKVPVAHVYSTEGRRLGTTGGHVGDITRVCVDPTGQYLATHSKDGWIRVWDMRESEVTAADGGARYALSSRHRCEPAPPPGLQVTRNGRAMVDIGKKVILLPPNEGPSRIEIEKPEGCLKFAITKDGGCHQVRREGNGFIVIPWMLVDES